MFYEFMRLAVLGLLFQAFLVCKFDGLGGVSAAQINNDQQADPENKSGLLLALESLKSSNNDDDGTSSMDNDYSSSSSLSFPLQDHQLRKRPGARYIYNPSGFSGGGGGGGYGYGRIVEKRPGARHFYYFNTPNGYDSRAKRPGARYFAPVERGELLKRLGGDRYYMSPDVIGDDRATIGRWKRGGARYVGYNYYGGGGRRYGGGRQNAYQGSWGRMYAG